MSPLNLLATLTAFALATAAQEMSILPYPVSSPSCTSTITHPPGCCPKIAAHTATSYTDCDSCALDIVTEGPMCMMYCGTHTPVDPEKTTTVTKCGPETTPSMTTKPKCTSTAKASCTNTVTEQNPFPCGDCGVGVVDVSTTVDCKGCVLTTTTRVGGVGICVCPTEPATRTVSVCKESAEAVVTG